MTALIIGLGLIGGSVARSLKKNSDWRVSGYDKDLSVLHEAEHSGALDGLWNEGTESDADITVICLPPSAAVSFLKNNVRFLKPGSVVTDVCGIKRWVVEQCDRICRESGLKFIGGHPMAGKERSGFKNSDENLFNRASYILTPVNTTDEAALDAAKKLALALNVAKITVTTPEHHDRIIAFTSQLPHIIAGAYVGSETCQMRHGFSAGSFKDVSRVATVDEHLWTELFMKNKEMLLPEIDCMIEKLKEYKNAIESGDNETLCEIIKHGRVIKENDLKETEREEKL